MKVLLKHGDTAGVSQYIGVKGELVLDRDTSVVRIMDGVTPGGHPAININYTVADPTITGPLNGANQVSCVPIIYATPFSGSGVHTESEWVIARDEILQDIVYASGFQDIHLTSLDLNSVNVSLVPYTTYYVAVRYKSSFGLISGFSSTIEFTTRLDLPENLHQTIIPSWVGTGDLFGSLVSVSGDGKVLVTRDAYNLSIGYSGSIYVYEKEGGEYIYKDKLVPFDQDPATIVALGADNGACVSRDGNTIAIADWSCRTDGVNAQGCVWVYVKASGVWVAQERIPAPIGHPTANGNRFGANILLSEDGNLLAVPAYYDDEMGTNSGAVYVYKRTGVTWSLLQKLIPPISNAYGQMGRNALCGTPNFDTLVCGSRLTVVDGLTGAGRVFVFSRSGDTWTPAANLASPSPYFYGMFGNAIILSDDGLEMLVGESGNPSYETTSIGSIHYYKKISGSWVWQLKIDPPVPQVGMRFGGVLSSNGSFTKIATTAILEDLTYPDYGAIYLYTKENGVFVFQKKLYPTYSGPTDTGFGSRMNLTADGLTLAVSVNSSNELYTNSGSIVIYK